MLADLLNVPRTPGEWAIWAFAHRQEHKEIVQAIQAQTGVLLVEYELDPIPETQITEWLERNQQSHTDFNGVLKLQSVDLESVDFKNKSQADAWIYLHYQEHYSARAALHI